MASSSTKTTRKPSKVAAAAKAAAKKPVTARKAPNPVPVKPVGVTAATPISVAKPAGKDNVVRKPELVERVVKASGLKKKDVKAVTEAFLGVVGEALAKGETLQILPLGKVMVKKTDDKGDARVVVARIRQPKGKTGLPKPALANKAD